MGGRATKSDIRGFESGVQQKLNSQDKTIADLTAQVKTLNDKVHLLVQANEQTLARLTALEATQASAEDASLEVVGTDAILAEELAIATEAIASAPEPVTATA
jgi:septal ring factor EnvC (AmiA/AmiB activator)